MNKDRRSRVCLDPGTKAEVNITIATWFWVNSEFFSQNKMTFDKMLWEAGSIAISSQMNCFPEGSSDFFDVLNPKTPPNQAGQAPAYAREKGTVGR